MRFTHSVALGALGALAGFALACRHGPPAGQPAPTTGQPAPLPAALTATIAEGEQAAVASLPAGDGQTLVEQNCLICHGAALIEQQHKDTTGWTKTVTLMRSWGSPLPPDQVRVLVEYLTAHYGARSATQ